MGEEFHLGVSPNVKAELEFAKMELIYELENVKREYLVRKFNRNCAAPLP